LVPTRPPTLLQRPVRRHGGGAMPISTRGRLAWVARAVADGNRLLAPLWALVSLPRPRGGSFEVPKIASLRTQTIFLRLHNRQTRTSLNLSWLTGYLTVVLRDAEAGNHWPILARSDCVLNGKFTKNELPVELLPTGRRHSRVALGQFHYTHVGHPNRRKRVGR
jgi:hypothetical protein